VLDEAFVVVLSISFVSNVMTCVSFSLSSTQKCLDSEMTPGSLHEWPEDGSDPCERTALPDEGSETTEVPREVFVESGYPDQDETA
jgi:hypothetical protein